MHRAYFFVFIAITQCKIIYYNILSLYNTSTFLCHRQGVLHLCFAKLHKFLKLKLLKLQLHKIIKYTKILFNR